MKALFWISALPALAFSYYFGLALPRHNEAQLAFEERKLAFEERKYADEESATTMFMRELVSCLEEAGTEEGIFWERYKKSSASTAQAAVLDELLDRQFREKDMCVKRWPLRAR